MPIIIVPLLWIAVAGIIGVSFLGYGVAGISQWIVANFHIINTVILIIYGAIIACISLNGKVVKSGQRLLWMAFFAISMGVGVVDAINLQKVVVYYAGYHSGLEAFFMPINLFGNMLFWGAVLGILAYFQLYSMYYFIEHLTLGDSPNADMRSHRPGANIAAFILSTMFLIGITALNFDFVDMASFAKFATSFNSYINGMIG